MTPERDPRVVCGRCGGNGTIPMLPPNVNPFKMDIFTAGRACKPYPCPECDGGRKPIKRGDQQ